MLETQIRLTALEREILKTVHSIEFEAGSTSISPVPGCYLVAAIDLPVGDCGARRDVMPAARRLVRLGALEPHGPQTPGRSGTVKYGGRFIISRASAPDDRGNVETAVYVGFESELQVAANKILGKPKPIDGNREHWNAWNAAIESAVLKFRRVNLNRPANGRLKLPDGSGEIPYPFTDIDNGYSITPDGIAMLQVEDNGGGDKTPRATEDPPDGLDVDDIHILSVLDRAGCALRPTEILTHFQKHKLTPSFGDEHLRKIRLPNLERLGYVTQTKRNGPWQLTEPGRERLSKTKVT